jgi:hypothetical protein
MVDIDSIMENARKEGIPLSQISLFYRDLTRAETMELENAGLIAHTSETGMVVAKFPTAGVPLFPEKITDAFYLGAD